METTVIKTNTPHNMRLIAFASVFGCIAVICLILHISPAKILEDLADLASHHYFIVGFVFLVICLTCIKIYYNNISQNSNSPVRTSRTARRRALLARLKKGLGIENSMPASLYIKKEDLKNLKYPSEELLTTVEEDDQRNKALAKARVLGNLYKQKAIIYFKDKYSLKHTTGTVWHVDDDYISLKGGATIPVKRIYKIEI